MLPKWVGISVHEARVITKLPCGRRRRLRLRSKYANRQPRNRQQAKSDAEIIKKALM